MLTRDQIYALLILSKRGGIFSLPEELIKYIVRVDDASTDSLYFKEALDLAASATEDDMIKLVEMVQKKPQLLLQRGFVKTRGGVHVSNVTPYEFFLGEGDPVGAKTIEFGFALLPNGQAERKHQYERYQPHIEALAKAMKNKKPAYDLKPLFKIIEQSSQEDVKAELNHTSNYRSKLRDALIAFRAAVTPNRKTVGMHYDHYFTLLQAIKLLENVYKGLSQDQCRLVWCQVFAYLQLSLPAVDRFVFAQALQDWRRTFVYKFGGSTPVDFPDTNSSGQSTSTGLGFDHAIFGRVTNNMWNATLSWEPGESPESPTWSDLFEKHMTKKLDGLKGLNREHQPSQRCTIC